MTRLDGSAGDANDPKLTALLAAAGAPAHPEERDEAALEIVLAAFNAAGSSGNGEQAAANGRAAHDVRTRRSVRRGARLSVRAAAVVVIAAASGMATASAGILPGPIQSLAHHVFGGIGVPAPGGGGGTGGAAGAGGVHGVSARASAAGTPTPQTTATASASAIPQLGSATTASAPPGQSAPKPTPTPPALPPPTLTPTLVSLCGQVIGSGDSWETQLSRQDVALLIAAAGTEKNVVPYCAQLLGKAHDAAPTPSASTSAAQGDQKHKPKKTSASSTPGSGSN